MVGEPSVDETIQILHGLRERYEQHHKLKISDEAVEAAAKLSDPYISDRYLPDKAIDLIDEEQYVTERRTTMTNITIALDKILTSLASKIFT
jgi:ATP-dependent Clp protease ATP-binding subunit ClpA